MTAGTVHLKFATERLAKNFGLPPPEIDPSEIFFERIDSRDLEEWIDTLDAKPDETLLVEDALRDANQFAYERAYWAAFEGALLEALETFSNLERFRGIDAKSIKINYEYTEFDAYPDLGNIINLALGGYGLFGAEDFPSGKVALKKELEAKFHNLRHWWEIYGMRKPRMEDIDPSRYWRNRDVKECFKGYRGL